MSDPERDKQRTESHPELSDEKLARLLRLTGPRPAIAEDRARRVKAAVRNRWRAGIPVWRRRRTWTIAALAAAAAALVVIGREWRSRQGVSPAPGAMTRVVDVSGAAWIRPAPSSPAAPGGARPQHAVRAGQEVPAGSRLETLEDGRLALRLTGGASLRLDVGTRVEIRSDRALSLLAGAVYFDSGGRGGAVSHSDDPIEIHTPAGRIREIGTQFEVRLVEAAVRLRVREGLVTVHRPSGNVEVRSGRELRVDETGETSETDLPLHGAEWAWIEAIAPMMEIEGRSLREFLDWMARERGLGIRFADQGLDAASNDILLNGSIKGMTLDQALESVLLTCRMRHRIAGDLLIVEPLHAPPGSS